MCNIRVWGEKQSYKNLGRVPIVGRVPFSFLWFSMSNKFSALSFLTLSLKKKKEETNIPVRSKIWRTTFLGCDEPLGGRLTRKKGKM